MTRPRPNSGKRRRSEGAQSNDAERSLSAESNALSDQLRNVDESENSTGASFEQSAERLGRIVEALEAGDRPLEESLALFEEGVRVAQAAQRRLERAERRVEELLGLDEKGEPRTRELEA